MHILEEKKSKTMNEHYPFENPPLPYAYNALEPYIDEKTMHLHHDRHLQTYVDNLNKTLAPHPELTDKSLLALVSCPLCLPSGLQIPVRNNAGGVYNHIFYFSNLTPNADMPIPSPLKEQIDEDFGSYGEFQTKFKEAALSVFGSGYTWLVKEPGGRLSIFLTKNQDTPLPANLFPLLNIDVWEHAYYLKHYNVRADYIDDWFHVVNWEQVNQNFRQIP